METCNPVKTSESDSLLLTIDGFLTRLITQNDVLRGKVRTLGYFNEPPSSTRGEPEKVLPNYWKYKLQELFKRIESELSEYNSLLNQLSDFV